MVVVDGVEVWDHQIQVMWVSVLLKVQTESSCSVAHISGSPALLNQNVCHSSEKQ